VSDRLSRRVLVTVALALAGSTGCAGTHRLEVQVRNGPPFGAPPSVALAPAVLLDAAQLDIAPEGLSVRSRDFGEADPAGAPPLGSPEQSQALLSVFYANVFVGKIWHRGGYDLLPEVGNQVRSLGLTFTHQADYARQALAWTDETLAEVLTGADRPWTRLDDSVESALRAPHRAAIRGTTKLDGQDNQNLPGFTLEPVALDPGGLPAGITAPQLLVPFVVSYYAHNGGWFVGQQKGCPAGARFRLLWVLYDTATGAVESWQDVDARTVEPFFYTPNDQQLEDYQIRVEDDVRAALEKALAR